MGKEEKEFREKIRKMAEEMDGTMQKNMNDVELLKTFSNSIQKAKNIIKTDKKYYFNETR